MYSLCQVWALVVMFLSKKYNRLPHFFTINLFFAQVSTRPHAPQAQLLNISSHFDAVKSFCGCKVTSVNVSLCFLYAFQFLTCIGMIVWSVVAIEEGPTGQIVVFMLLWTSQYSTYMWPGMLCPHIRRSPLNCTDVFCWPLTCMFIFQFSLFRFDSAFSCAAEEIWGSERFPSGVLLCRLGVSQLSKKWNLTCLL